MSSTPAQLRILRFVRDAISRKEYPPTRTEIQHAFGFASPNAAQKHLQALAAKGLIELLDGTARGIRVAGAETGGTDARAADGVLNDLVAKRVGFTRHFRDTRNGPNWRIPNPIPC